MLLLCMCFLAPILLWGQSTQQRPTKNPFANDPEAIKEGASLFRPNCSPCHGLSAKGGGRGPDLTSGRWTHGSTDEDIFRTISEGVPGTAMPENNFEDAETWRIIAYLRSLAPLQQAKPIGNPINGARLFTTAGCSVCHMVKGQGGLLGPDLTRVGASRSDSYLVESIRDPNSQLSDGIMDPNNHYGSPLVYDTVTVVLKDGNTVVGVAKNEDTFSVQLMDTNQVLRFFLKSEVKEVVHERKSLMPTYSEQTINKVELEDLVAYLESLGRE